MVLTVILIRLYPIIGLCLGYICFEFARSLRLKGRSSWMIPAFIMLLVIASIVLWGMERGDLHAEQWAKDWYNSN